jgi:O-acetyl-ADP-ribose deacetylase (regulator of RNase III)
MSSSSFLRSKIVPKLHYRFTTTTTVSDDNRTIQRSIEIWTTTCIVTNFTQHLSQQDQYRIGTCNKNNKNNNNTKQRWILINPSNSQLTGCKLFPYFPKGGPIPDQPIQSSVHRDWQPLGYVTQWGGMEVGTGMLYPISVIDGLVHIYGGWSLQAEIYWLRLLRQTRTTPNKFPFDNFWSKQNNNSNKNNKDHDNNELCPIGTAIQTSAGNGLLSKYYQSIVHTTPPFYKYNTHPTVSVETLLSNCYRNALQLAFTTNTTTMYQSPIIHVALPLLGAGARGFPNDVACTLAAQSLILWLSGNNTTTPAAERTIQFQIFDNKTSTETLNESIVSTKPTNANNITYLTVAFGLLEVTIAKQLANELFVYCKNI